MNLRMKIQKYDVRVSSTYSRLTAFNSEIEASQTSRDRLGSWLESRLEDITSLNKHNSCFLVLPNLLELSPPLVETENGFLFGI